MARIRSVHPGLFTDEAFASLPTAARIFLIGIWTESDDHGIFEWKPLGLKMKIFPADALTNDDVTGLLEKLVGAECVVKFDHDGKPYGAVRNFCKWQRPKKPTYRHPLPKAYRTYVGIEGNKDGKPPADEGCMLEDVIGGGNPKTTTVKTERESPAISEKPAPSAPDSLSEASPKVLKKPSLEALGSHLPEEWIPDDELMAEVMREFGMTDADVRAETYAFHAHHAAAGSFSANWRASFLTWCKRWKEHRDKQAPPRVQVSNTKPKRPEEFTDAEWDNHLGFYARTGRWSSGLGPDPMSAACKAPRHLWDKHDINANGERRIPPRKPDAPEAAA